MGKRLIFNYTFDASAKTITLEDVIAEKRFLLITNVTTGDIIYQFNDVNLGASNLSFDYDNFKTTMTLIFDTTSMSDTDELQIFVEEDSTDITVNDRFVDPVSKIRVSNPENLIDTDFEYGLQSTKWETLELTKNIPTFFSRSGDIPIEITSMNVRQNSDIVTVVTGIAHGFQRGSPIIIKSSGSVSADGGFVVAGVIDSTTFNFKAKTTFLQTRSILESFTELFPASVYAGTEFKLTNIGGITTDGLTPSEITVNTVYPTDFKVGTSMALSNTFAKSTLDFQTNDVEIDNVRNLNISYTSATPTGENDAWYLGGVNAIEWLPRQPNTFSNSYIFFAEDEITVDSVNNTITFPEPHGFNLYTPFYYAVEQGTNTPIQGSLNPFQTYYAYPLDDYTIKVQRLASTSSSFTINLTGAGISGGIQKSAFIEVGLHFYYFNSDYGRMYLKYGVGVYRGGGSSDMYNELLYSQSANPVSYIYHNWEGSNPDFSVVSSVFNLNRNTSSTYDYYIRAYSFGFAYDYYVYTSTFSRLFVSRTYSTDMGVQYTQYAATKSSLWVPNHGLEVGKKYPVTVSATTGTLPAPLSSGGIYLAEYLSENRISLSYTSGADISFTTSGSANLEYNVSGSVILETSNSIYVPANTLNEGDAIVYDVNGGTEIGGLTDGTTYYVSLKKDDTFKISTTQNVYAETASCLAQNSFTWVNLTNDTILLDSNPYSTGDAVIYASLSPITGLYNGAIYWVNVSGSNITLYNSKADAIAATNRINLLYYGSGRGNFTKVNIIDITSAPSGETQKFQADFIGAADGIYSVSSLAADKQSFTFTSESQIEARTKTVTAQSAFVAALDALYIPDHGFITGDIVTYTESGTTNLNGLNSGSDYYVIRSNKDFIKFASSEENALTGTSISLTEAGTSPSAFTGSISLQPTTIVGSFNGSGTITFAGGSNTILGDGTSFRSYFNAGDSIFINIPESSVSTNITAVNTTTDVFTAAANTIVTGDMITFSGDAAPGGINFGYVYFARAVTPDTFSVHYTASDASANSNLIPLTTIGTNVSVTVRTTVGSIEESEVHFVNSDTEITTTNALPSTGQTDVNYLQNTGLLLRPDGFALHRPYDGGVELIPPTNPDSQMIRQTRKYFRYQSGKGIQVSFAVNFSPTSQIDSFTRIGNVGTIVTRFPHRLSTSLYVTTSGSTNTNLDTLGTITKFITVNSDPITSAQRFEVDNVYSTSHSLYEGRTYRYDVSDATMSGHSIRFSKTQDGTHGGGTELTAADTDVFSSYTVVGTSGSSGAYIEFVLAADAPNIYTYCAVGTHTGYGYVVPTIVDPDNNKANLWNGSLKVLSIVDQFTFTVQLPGVPSDNSSLGVVEYYVNNWENSSLRCGLFDDQNGIFFEYDGEQLYCCRRSSIRQISGYANLSFKSAAIEGVGTKFASQLSVGDYVVIKGQSHRITKISGDELMYVSPSYRGVSAEKVIITKTETTKVPQSFWNLDPCDGTGYTGFYLNIHKIQMAYIDYSWYGAGKVRFGFKDQHGNVRYVHSFVHGNFFTEAYMRSGNVPARYEIQNEGTPTYVPALAHWGTSVIMDGRFDPDKAYIFNANSNNLTLTGVSQLTVSARIDYTGVYYTRISSKNYPVGYALLLANSDGTLNSIVAGTEISGANLAANTKAANPLSSLVSPFQPYLPSFPSKEGDVNFFGSTSYRNLLLISPAPTGTSVSNSSYLIGPASGGELQVNKDLPLISVRLAPSVDTSAPGFLGEREIVNRMQLILNQVNILSTHAVSVKLILNGQLSSNDWQRVTNPSLSQVIYHTNTDTITGGQSVYDFEGQGGTGTSNRQPVLTEQNLGDIATLGNSILGGDGVFPDGPDVLTVVATLSEDPSTVSSTNPFQVTGRISWSESQA